MAKRTRFTESDLQVLQERLQARPKLPAVTGKVGRGKESRAKEALRLCAAEMGLPAPEFEHRFHSKRRWRLDVAWPEHKVAVEIMGGTWTQGRHTRGGGYEADCEKLNAATLAGWRVLSYTYPMLERLGSKAVLAVVRELMG